MTSANLLAWRGALLSAVALASLLSASVARAEGLLRIDDCRIVDGAGPVKAIGVNYVDGFWTFAKSGDRAAYLPYLDALAQAKVPFLRMAFGPWASSKAGAPPAPAIADFVAHRDRYFERLDAFLADAKARRIGVVLDVFWNVDPYVVYFGDPPSAWLDAKSKTSVFLRETVAELARRHGDDPTIWMVEFLNEGNLLVDFTNAPHTRAELRGLLAGLAGAARAAGDRHLIDTGNSLPRPAAAHLNARHEWKADALPEFLSALDAETPARVEVASVHAYPEDKATRPWDEGDIFNALPALSQYSRQHCRPAFLGEFGAPDPDEEKRAIDRVARSDIQLAAVWGFGRGAADPFAFGIDAKGRTRLRWISQTP